MGENDNRPLIPVYVYDESRNIVAPLVQMRTLTDSDLLPDDPGAPGMAGYYRGADFSSFNDAASVTIYGRLRLRHMSRKRFIKLLMSKGCPRNISVALAEYWLKQCVPYSDAWLYMTVFCFR